ncbi:hypothetical protein [Wenjunlia tyrosinilytica]|uniref:Uncharacterized protein n=1 Tax=Wenjunlia tyrosinilytica TaxID=1544741 RepID=A0A917ZPI0_9ACTN|nr:hypothetical protein [Wenjunlia tyrosinilytica]GGO87634.1 hypothetical protein GCM10012280_26540 [Wenjunlia tyrosinilytica]
MNTQEWPADHVDVHLSGCSPQDAQTVFGALETAFPTAHAAVHGQAGGATRRQTVWIEDVEVRVPAENAGPVALSGTVTADLFGCDRPVRMVRDALVSSFAVEDLGLVSGDGEVEARMRLASSR